MNSAGTTLNVTQWQLEISANLPEDEFANWAYATGPRAAFEDMLTLQWPTFSDFHVLATEEITVFQMARADSGEGFTIAFDVCISVEGGSCVQEVLGKFTPVVLLKGSETPLDCALVQVTAHTPKSVFWDPCASFTPVLPTTEKERAMVKAIMAIAGMSS